MKKQIEKLLNSDINSSQLAKMSGVDQPTIHRIRKGESKLGNISLDKAEKLYEAYKEMKKVLLFNEIKEELSYRQKDNYAPINNEKFLKININNTFNVAIKEESDEIEMYIHDKRNDSLELLYKGESVKDALIHMSNFELQVRSENLYDIKKEFSKYYNEVEFNKFEVTDEYYIQIPEVNSFDGKISFMRKDEVEDERLFFMMMNDINVDNYVNRSIKRYL